MEPGTPHHSIYNNNQNNNTVHGDNTAVLNFNPVSNVVQQQTRADSKLQYLYKLLSPLEGSTRMGINVPKDGCLVGTRLELLQRISDFVSDTDPPHTCLILGLAGMGKSALARSIADTLTHSGIVVVSYFISRSILQSRKIERLVQTLAYQLAKHDPMFCERLLATLKSDPGLLQHSLNDQVQRLLVSPLISVHSTVTSPLAIIIDGLDEAEDVQVLLSELIVPLALVLVGLPRRIKLIVSSRELGALRMARSRGGLEGLVDEQWLHKIEETTVRRDMRTFIADGLGRLAERADLGPAWPPNAQINALTDRAGSLFIYAATVLQFLEGQPLPNKLLEQLLSSDQKHTTASTDGSPFAKLDALYDQVLHTCVGATPLSLESDLIKQLRMLLAGVVYSAEPMSMRMLSGVLGIDLSDLNLMARNLAAIWVVPQDADGLLIVHHLSFSEFIGDAKRCTEACFCVTPAAAHELLATACLHKMNHVLRRDICDLIKPGASLPRIEDYALGLVENCVESTLTYACFHGVDTHLRQCLPGNSSKNALSSALVEHLVKFCDNHLLHWVEVRAVFGQDSLNALIKTLYSWTKSEPVDACVRVCQALVELHDMVQEFQTTILASPPEIYNTCLAMLPSGLLVSTYAGNLDAMVRRVTPRPDSWPDARFLFSQAATATCSATEGYLMAYGFVETRENLLNGQSYALLWSAMPTTPVRLDMPHADDFALHSMAFSAAADRLVTLSSGHVGSLKRGSLITVWDLSVLRVISLRRVATSILGVSFNASSSHIICVTCDPLVPVLLLPNSLDGFIPKPLHIAGCYVPSFSADRTGVAFGNLNGSLFWASESMIWRPVELPDSNRKHETPHSNPLRDFHIIISSNGSVVVASFYGRILRVWNMAQPKSPRMFQLFTGHSYGSTRPSALSADGRLIAFHGRGETVSMTLLTVGQLEWGDQPRFVPLTTWPCLRDTPIQFSNDASFIAAFDRRQVLKVWDVGTGRELARADIEPTDSNCHGLFTLPGSVATLQILEHHRLRQLGASYSKLPAHISSHNLIFTSTGVVGSKNGAGKSYAVLLSSHGHSYRHFPVLRLSRFCYWLAASLARTQAEFSAVPIYDPLEATMKSGLVRQMTQGPNLFVFAPDDTFLVFVQETRIYSHFSSSLHGQMYSLEFSVDVAAFSARRKALAVTRRDSGLILVFMVQPEGIQLYGRYRVPPRSSSSSLSCMEFDSDGSHLLLSRRMWRSGYSYYDQPKTINESIEWSQIKDDGTHEGAEYLASDTDEELVIDALYSAVRHALPTSTNLPEFVESMSQIGGDLVWNHPLLYLNATHGGPMVFDFSRHPSLQQPTPTEPPAVNPELRINDQGGYPPFSDDDCYEGEPDSDDE